MFFDTDRNDHGLPYNPVKALDRAAPNRLDHGAE